MAQQLELGTLPPRPYTICGIVWVCGLKETMISNYLTASHARHVTFPRVFPIGLWGVQYSLFIIYSCYYYIDDEKLPFFDG